MEDQYLEPEQTEQEQEQNATPAPGIDVNALADELESRLKPAQEESDAPEFEDWDAQLRKTDSKAEAAVAQFKHMQEALEVVANPAPVVDHIMKGKVPRHLADQVGDIKGEVEAIVRQYAIANPQALTNPDNHRAIVEVAMGRVVARGPKSAPEPSGDVARNGKEAQVREWLRQKGVQADENYIRLMAEKL